MHGSLLIEKRYNVFKYLNVLFFSMHWIFNQRFSSDCAVRFKWKLLDGNSSV